MPRVRTRRIGRAVALGGGCAAVTVRREAGDRPGRTRATPDVHQSSIARCLPRPGWHRLPIAGRAAVQAGRSPGAAYNAGMTRARTARWLPCLYLFAALLQAAMPLHASAMAVGEWRLAIGVCSVGGEGKGDAREALTQAACAGCVIGGGAVPPAIRCALHDAALPGPVTPADRLRIAAVDPSGPPPATGPPRGARAG